MEAVPLVLSPRACFEQPDDRRVERLPDARQGTGVDARRFFEGGGVGAEFREDRERLEVQEALREAARCRQWIGLPKCPVCMGSDRRCRLRCTVVT